MCFEIFQRVVNLSWKSLIGQKLKGRKEVGLPETSLNRSSSVLWHNKDNYIGKHFMPFIVAFRFPTNLFF
jgi:hypothetical protein